MHDPLRDHLEHVFVHVQLATLLQPIVDLEHDEIFGYEAFARLPSDSPLSTPAALSGAARRYGLLGAFDWARTALGAARFVHLGLAGRLLVRVEPDSLFDAHFQPPFLTRALAAAGLPPERLVLDAGELSASSVREFVGIAQRLQAEGIGFAMAGCGACGAPGAAFVRVDVRRSIADVASGIPFAQSAAPGCALVAVGVDAPSDLVTVRAQGIRYAQGRLIADPSPVPLRRVPDAVRRRAVAQARRSPPHR